MYRSGATNDNYLCISGCHLLVHILSVHGLLGQLQQLLADRQVVLTDHLQLMLFATQFIENLIICVILGFLLHLQDP